MHRVPTLHSYIYLTYTLKFFIPVLRLSIVFFCHPWGSQNAAQKWTSPNCQCTGKLIFGLLDYFLPSLWNRVDYLLVYQPIILLRGEFFFKDNIFNDIQGRRKTYADKVELTKEFFQICLRALWVAAKIVLSFV